MTRKKIYWAVQAAPWQVVCLAVWRRVQLATERVLDVRPRINPLRSSAIDEPVGAAIKEQRGRTVDTPDDL